MVPADQWVAFLTSVLGPIGSGVTRLQGALSVTGLRALAGSALDVATLFGQGLFQYVPAPGTGSSDDGINYLTSAAPNWPGSGQTILFNAFCTHDAGKIYQCTIPGMTGATGPSGTGTQPLDGTVQWVYVTAPGQWVYSDVARLDVPGGVAGLDTEGFTGPVTGGTGVVPKFVPTKVTPFATGNSYDFTSGWGNASGTTVAFWKDRTGMVHIHGAALNTSGASGVIFQLPAGFRPAFQRTFAAPILSGIGEFSCVTCWIDTSGNVTTLNNEVQYSLDGICFLAEA